MLQFLRSLCVVLVASASVAAGPAFAQAWPNRPVTLVVPYSPGASNDTFTRAIAGILSKKFGQPFVVENRPGAGGYTGAAAVQKAAPDGYTFLESPSGIVAIKETMKHDLDAVTDIATVSVFAKSPSALIVPASLPVNNVAEFLDYAKKSPQPLFYGYSGAGNTGQIYPELLTSLTGVKFQGVNYKSSAETTTDLIAGRLQIQFVSVAAVMGQLKSGQVKLLAYAVKNEAEGAPPAPTFADAGIKGMDVAQLWWGMFAPKGLPPDILKKMNEAINEALKDPSVVDLFAKSGAAPWIQTPEESSRVVKQEVETLLTIIKDANLKFE
jgi:tripartite-type tricarboxylate transporter receptor subunit TctC